MTTEFVSFPKIARWNRELIVTEKIDGSNACIVIASDATASAPPIATTLYNNPDVDVPPVRLYFWAQSRNRFIKPGDDNFGFAGWVAENIADLVNMGGGYHYGEWYGRGIQRGYGLDHKRFALFPSKRHVTPECCHYVPTISENATAAELPMIIDDLRVNGSRAVPGFMQPEGIVAYHTASRSMYKITCQGDEKGKGQ